MNLIFISIFLTIAFCVFLFIFLFVKLENLEKKQKKDHEHVLKNLKYLTSLTEFYFKNEK